MFFSATFQSRNVQGVFLRIQLVKTSVLKTAYCMLKLHVDNGVFSGAYYCFEGPVAQSPLNVKEHVTTMTTIALAYVKVAVFRFGFMSSCSLLVKCCLSLPLIHCGSFYLNVFMICK